MRLIDADEMLQDESEAYMKAQVALSRKGSDATVMLNQLVHKKLQMLIADTPTIDAVPVVRCKDCRYYDYPFSDSAAARVSDGANPERWCCRLGLVGAFDKDDYCSHGERKTAESE